MPRGRAILAKATVSTACPNKWTGMMAFVAGVTSEATCCGIDIEGLRIDVGKDRPCAQPRDRAGRGEEREAGQDHLVAGGDVQGHQGQQQGVAARGAADGVFCLAVDGQLLFELRDLRARARIRRYRRPGRVRRGFPPSSPQCWRPKSKSGTPWIVPLLTSLPVIGETHRGCPEKCHFDFPARYW